MTQAEQAVRRPYTDIVPGSGWQILDLKELAQYWDLLITLAERDLKLRYRQTALGAIWIVIQPLLTAGVFAFVFGRVAKLPSDGVPYVVFAYAGTIGWNAFLSTFVKASGSLIGNTSLVSKVYFPRIILPLSTAFSSVVDTAISLVLLAVFFAIYRIAPTPGLLLAPVWFLLLTALGLGFGLAAASLVVRYRDVSNMVVVLGTLLLYASPVAYSVSAVPAHLRTVYMLNPISGLLEGFRWSLLGRGGMLSPSMLAYSVIAALAVFLFGAVLFRRLEQGFADVI